jgi:hypothetical protein
LAGYSMGRCRCNHCRTVCSRYRAARRATGQDRPVDTDGHVSRNWFLHHVWKPARSQRQASSGESGCTTSDTHTHPGCSPEEQTCRWCANDSDTPACDQPSGICTRCPTATSGHSPRSATSATDTSPNAKGLRLARRE